MFPHLRFFNTIYTQATLPLMSMILTFDVDMILNDLIHQKIIHTVTDY